jgi:hypothetical protein
MSRTYRRKIGSKNHYSHYFVTHELIVVESATGRKYFQWMPLDKDSKEYKKAMAIYHSDSGTFSFKEPGPSWFRKLFTERPQRRESERQLRKYLLDEEFEVILNPKDKLEYWT